MQGVHFDIWLYAPQSMNTLQSQQQVPHHPSVHRALSPALGQPDDAAMPSDGSEVMYCNGDDQNRYGCRAASHIFPLKRAPYLGVNMSIPAAPHTISLLTYGESYDQTVRYRADCLHNFVHGRLWH